MSEYKYAYLTPGHYARGWHIVLFSQELKVGEVKPLHYFEHEFVAYRGESGRVYWSSESLHQCLYGTAAKNRC